MTYLGYNRISDIADSFKWSPEVCCNEILLSIYMLSQFKHNIYFTAILLITVIKYKRKYHHILQFVLITLDFIFVLPSKNKTDDIVNT